jgi:hypothetical protein
MESLCDPQRSRALVAKNARLATRAQSHEGSQSSKEQNMGLQRIYLIIIFFE